MNIKIFCQTLISVAFLAFGLNVANAAPPYLGSEVKSGAMTSTCEFLLNNQRRCTATLTEDGSFRIASHCVQLYYPQNASIRCTGTDGKKFFSPIKTIRSYPLGDHGFISRIFSLKTVWPKEDSARLETVRSPLRIKGLYPVTELDEKDLINLFVLKNDQYTLRPEISCWAESYGPTLENHTSAHRVEIDDPTFQVQEGVIRYQVQGQGNPKNCPECFEYTGNGIDLKILKLIVKEVSVKAISIPGDSGSPLYCKDQNSKIFLVGTLYGGGTNVLSHDGKVLLRSIWTPIYSNKKLINTWERDKTTP